MLHTFLSTDLCRGAEIYSDSGYEDLCWAKSCLFVCFDCLFVCWTNIRATFRHAHIHNSTKDKCLSSSNLAWEGCYKQIKNIGGAWMGCWKWRNLGPIPAEWDRAALSVEQRGWLPNYCAEKWAHHTDGHISFSRIFVYFFVIVKDKESVW